MRGPDTSERASTTFCWLPPDSWPTGLSASGVAMPSALIISCASRSCSARESRRSQPRLVCSARMMFSRTVSSPNIPSALRSSGQNAMPRRSDWRRRVGRHRRAADLEPAGIAPDRAEHELGDLGAARPEQPGEPDHLAGAQREIEGRHHAPAPESLGDEDRLALRGPVVACRAAASVSSSSRPSISEISFSRGSSAVGPSPTRRPLRRTEMRSAIR